MNSLQTIIFTVFLICLFQEGLVALMCRQCRLRDAICPPSGEIGCTSGSNEVCVNVQVIYNNAVRFFKGCRDKSECNNTDAICNLRGRPKCLAYGCCEKDRCNATLTPIPGPSSVPTTPTTSPPGQAATTDAAMLTLTIAPSSTLAPLSTPATTPILTPTPAPATPSTIEPADTKSTEEGMMTSTVAPSTPTARNGTTVIHSLVRKFSTTARPTCEDSSGIRCMISPLAYIFVATGLVQLVI